MAEVAKSHGVEIDLPEEVLPDEATEEKPEAACGPHDLGAWLRRFVELQDEKKAAEDAASEANAAFRQEESRLLAYMEEAGLSKLSTDDRGVTVDRREKPTIRLPSKNDDPRAWIKANQDLCEFAHAVGAGEDLVQPAMETFLTSRAASKRFLGDWLETGRDPGRWCTTCLGFTGKEDEMTGLVRCEVCGGQVGMGTVEFGIRTYLGISRSSG